MGSKGAPGVSSGAAPSRSASVRERLQGHLGLRLGNRNHAADKRTTKQGSVIWRERFDRQVVVRTSIIPPMLAH